MQRLFICEKASLAKTVVDGLFKKFSKRDGFFEADDGTDVVAWSHGHILALEDPEAYDEKYKAWTVVDLPIVPTTWKYKINDKKTFDKLAALIKDCRKSGGVIVNVGDADREGQLLIDEIFMYLGIDISRSGEKILRLYITDPTPQGVKKSVDSMIHNDCPKCRGSFNAAVTRSRADWIIGMSGTRLCTRTSTLDETEHIGRVQTPTLALIVKRDLEIENFVAKPFWVLTAELEAAAGKFTAVWKPKDDWNGLDEANRIVNQSLLESKKNELSGASGTVTKYTTKQEKEGQEMPHCLSSLQVEASKEYGFSPQETLDLLQTLYERKLTTYPRSDCSYLPTSMYEQKEQILDSIFVQFDELRGVKGLLRRDLKTKAWNDAKVAEHFGIIPTSAQGSMSEDEKKIYKLVALRYVAQFLPPRLFNVVEAEALISGELFTSKVKRCTSEGWKVLYPPKKNANGTVGDGTEEKDFTTDAIPELRVGDTVRITTLNETEKKTSPPKRFTEGSIIDAMTNIYRYVDEPKFRLLLKEAEGIGTAATRATVIENLKARKDIVVKNKAIISTPRARTRINETPSLLKSAGVTAIWENAFKNIEAGEMTSEEFLKQLAALFLKIKEERLKTHPERKKPFSNKQGSNSFAPGAKKGGTGATGKEQKCPDCGGQLLQIRSKSGKLFWKCQNNTCEKFFNDVHGSPKKDFSHSKGKSL